MGSLSFLSKQNRKAEEQRNFRRKVGSYYQSSTKRKNRTVLVKNAEKPSRCTSGAFSNSEEIVKFLPVNNEILNSIIRIERLNQSFPDFQFHCRQK